MLKDKRCTSRMKHSKRQRTKKEIAQYRQRKRQERLEEEKRKREARELQSRIDKYKKDSSTYSFYLIKIFAHLKVWDHKKDLSYIVAKRLLANYWSKQKIPNRLLHNGDDA